jgi:hypothetical protein
MFVFPFELDSVLALFSLPVLPFVIVYLAFSILKFILEARMFLFLHKFLSKTHKYLL